MTARSIPAVGRSAIEMLKVKAPHLNVTRIAGKRLGAFRLAQVYIDGKWAGQFPLEPLRTRGTSLAECLADAIAAAFPCRGTQR